MANRPIRAALAALVAGALVCLAALGRQAAEDLSTKDIGDQYSPGVWAHYKKHFGKQYPSTRLDDLHRTIFARRVDYLKSIARYCSLDEHYPITNWTDRVRSTLSSHIEPTHDEFIRLYMERYERKYSKAETGYRRDLIRIFLEQRALMRHCCKVPHEASNELTDRTIAEIQKADGDPHQWVPVHHCNNKTGGRY